MTKKRVGIFIVLPAVIYLVFAFILPEYWEKQYSSESFDLRKEKKLPLLTNSYELDTSYSEQGIYYYQS